MTETVIFENGVEIKLPLFLDHQSTTPLAPEAKEAVFSAFETPGNADSKSHSFGFQARKIIETARQQVASLISAKADEIIFTSGATESNNLALKGLSLHTKEKRHIVSVCTEHSSILEPLKKLENDGYHVTLLLVNCQGNVNLFELESAFRPDTLMVSIQAANNEIGTLQDMKAIGGICEKHAIPVHCDAAQALATQQIDVTENSISLLSLSSHKLYGPQGIGALYVKRGTKIAPQIQGGEQQSVRAGTLPTALIAGFGAACAIAEKQRERDKNHLLQLSDLFQTCLLEKLHGNIQFNGHPTLRLPGCLNISFKDIDAEELLLEMPTLALSTGAACHSASGTPSHVLKAIGLNAGAIASTVRIGLGRYVTEPEATYAANVIIDTYNKLRTPYVST